MGFIKDQLLSVVEWNNPEADVLLHKFESSEIKKGSKLNIRPGQDAIFLYNGKIEGIFQDEGQFDIESQIIPFLSTLKAFKFAFNNPLRAEVVFINTTDHLVKWGTKNALNLPAPGLPGGMPIRCFGNFSCKIDDITVFIDKIAGVHPTYSVNDVKERMIGSLDQLLMSHIVKDGRDMFNLQADARAIAEGIRAELDEDMRKIGIAITDFKIENFSYPEEIAKMQQKAAAQAMVGDVNKYQQIAAADALAKGGNGGSVASDMVQMQMGMMMGQQMVQNMNAANGAAAPQAVPQGAAPGGAYPKFCPNCGTPTTGSAFCGNCGAKLS